MYVTDCMRTKVYTIGIDEVLRSAMQIMAEHMIGTLPVIDAERYVLGVLTMNDVLTQFMPHFVEVMRSTDFVHDYGVLEAGRKAPHVVDKAVRDIMHPPYYVTPDSGLMAAMVLMSKLQVSEAPVVNDDKQLIGIVSRVQVGSVFLKDWLSHFAEKD